MNQGILIRRDSLPFRQSKLTYLLKDSIGGGTKMSVVANIWPEAQHIEETISTLKFVSRLCKMVNLPKQRIHINQELMLKKYEQEIKDLKSELNMHDVLVGRGRVNYESYPNDQKNEQFKLALRFLNNEIDDIDFESIRQVKELFFQFRNIYRSHSNKEVLNSELNHLGENQLGAQEGAQKRLDDYQNRMGREELNNGFGLGTYHGKESANELFELDQNIAPKSQKGTFFKETSSQRLERKLGQLDSKEFVEDDVLLNGKLDRNSLFKAFKENQGSSKVTEIQSIKEDIKNNTDKYNSLKQKCRKMKEQIDLQKEELIDQSEEQELSDSVLIAKNNFRITKNNYKKLYQELIFLKKKIKEILSV